MQQVVFLLNIDLKKVIINLTQKKHGCCQTQMNCAQVICSHISKKTTDGRLFV